MFAALEEAGELAGAGPATRLFRIVGPAVRPSQNGGGGRVFVMAMRELDADGKIDRFRRRYGGKKKS